MSGIMESAGTRHWRHAPSAAPLVPSSLMLQRRRLPLLVQGKVWEQAAGGLQWSRNGLSDPGLWHHCGSLLILGRKRAEIRGLGTVSLNVHMQRVPAAASSFGFGVGLRKRRHLVSDFRGSRGRRNLSLIIRSHAEIASGVEIINSLGLDTLTFLAATVFFVPAFKAIKASPILGFLLSGVILNQLGLIRNVTEIKALAELGILFLLFEMGLELSLARLKALAKFAFGIGLAQVILCTLAFTAFELPPGGAMGTKILEFMFHAKPSLVDIRSIDEAVVIGAALSLSSSAFVLQLLAEKGELPTRFGSATLGILLLQDIAVVPLLVILPILESGNFTEESLWPMLAVESLKALGGLGALSFGGQLFLRRLFEIVADSRSSEAFVALCLLTVTGTSLLTQMLGFSDTLGAFLAGALLAETNYRTQVEADIRPFRGLLLGLFFVTTGTSIDMQLLLREWPNIVALLVGLITIKTSIIIAIGPRVGLTLAESVRLGLLLSQGGEFAFVVFSLANRLGVLPLELNRLLIIVVVLSMALTPFLNELGRKAAEMIEAGSDGGDEFVEAIGVRDLECNSPVVILGFGQMGQVLANFLSAPLATGHGGDAAGWPYVAFDLDPGRVKAARKLGFPVLYGDGARPAVLETVGISMPKAVMVMYTGRQKAVRAVERLRLAFPGVPIYARAQDLGHLLELKAAGATDAILENAETSLELGSVLLRGLGVLSDDVVFLRRLMRESMELRAQEALEKKDAQEGSWFGPFQAKVKQAWRPRTNSKPAASYEDEASSPAASASTNSKPTVWSAGNAQTGSASSQLLPANGARPDVQSTVLEPGNGSFLDDGAPGGSILSASVAVVAPTGLILEKQPGSGTGSGSACQEQQQQQQEQQQPEQELQQARTGAGYGVLPDALTVTMSSEPVGAATESTASQQTSLASSRLKWRKVRRFAGEEDGGVTVCSLEPPSEELVAEGESEDEAEDELDQSLPCIELEMRGSKDRDC